MADFNRKKRNNLWNSPLVLLVLFVILVVFAYDMVGLVEKAKDTSKKKDLILSQIEDLRSRQDSLNKDINKLNTSEGVEEIIRDKYQVVKEGEKMVVITDPEGVDNQEQQEVKPTDHSFLGWIKRTFKL